MHGWIKLHRQITDNEFYRSERFTKMQAWIDLLLLASHANQTLFIRGVEIKLKAGELCYSQLSLAKRWKWNFKTVKKFLKFIETKKMAVCRFTSVTTVITILNWEKYQVDGEQNGERMESRTETNKNDKNVNNVNGYLLTQKPAVFNTCRNFFITYVKSKINPDYVFDAREGKHLKDILKKISSMVKSHGCGVGNIPDAHAGVFMDDNIGEAFRYIITNITDKWLLERFTLSKINSQFNETIQGIKNQNGADRTFDELAEELHNNQLP
jgi:hypothetical protein